MCKKWYVARALHVCCTYVARTLHARCTCTDLGALYGPAIGQAGGVGRRPGRLAGGQAAAQRAAFWVGATPAAGRRPAAASQWLGDRWTAHVARWLAGRPAVGWPAGGWPPASRWPAAVRRQLASWPLSGRGPGQAGAGRRLGWAVGGRDRWPPPSPPWPLCSAPLSARFGPFAFPRQHSARARALPVNAMQHPSGGTAGERFFAT